jgi:hypothetical protein
MSKFAPSATLLAVVLSWSAISCTGPIFIHPPAAAATLASATTPGASTGPATSGALAGPGALATVIFGVLGLSMFFGRGKAPSAM